MMPGDGWFVLILGLVMGLFTGAFLSEAMTRTNIEADLVKRGYATYEPNDSGYAQFTMKPLDFVTPKKQ